MTKIIFSLILSLGLLIQSPGQGDYTITNIEPPEGAVLEVGGMDWMPDGRLMMCTRRGDIWSYHPDTEEWKHFATGLHEPLGLLAGKDDNEIFVMQRPELARIVDTDGDGDGDQFDTFGKGWGYTGNYHEYAFGLVRDKEGSFYGTLGLGFFPGFAPFKPQWCSHGNVPWRGWFFKITKEGEYIPLAPGCREPNGLGMNPEGDIFFADNQGSYIPCGVIVHATEGDFLGHPDGLIYDKRHPEAATYDINKLNAMRKRPALYLPYRELGASCTAPNWDTTGGKFGPFAGDVLVGDINTPKINRGTMEKVNGEYQGAAYPFIDDPALGGGSNRLLFHPKTGHLYVGQTGRGWASGIGLKRLEWTGKTSMDIDEVSLTKTGFRISFTQPAGASAADPAAYKISSWICEYTRNYGSGRLEQKNHLASSATLATDGRSVELAIGDLEADRLVFIQCPEVATKTGEKVRNGKAWYTLNQLRN